MKKEIKIEDILDYVNELGLKVKSEFDEAMKHEPTTVDELDEQTEIPGLEGEDTTYDEPETSVIPKWKAIELQVLDIIGNTLGGEKPITLETAATLETLTKVRESILRYRF